MATTTKSEAMESGWSTVSSTDLPMVVVYTTTMDVTVGDRVGDRLATR
jgi:hypothetical protein